MTATDHTTEARPDAASRDRLYAALSLAANRTVVAYFRETGDEQASLRALADVVARRRSKTWSRDRVAVRLHHVALPKLEAAGVLEYDPTDRTVRRTQLPADAVPTRDGRND